MKRFYFEFHDGDRIYCDEVGRELESSQAARDIAITMLPPLSVPLAVGQDRCDISVQVRDDGGAPILTARLSLSVEWQA